MVDLQKSLIIDASINKSNIPTKLLDTIQRIQSGTNSINKELLIQQTIGYIVACRDFEKMEKTTCDMLIDRLHDIR